MSAGEQKARVCECEKSWRKFGNAAYAVLRVFMLTLGSAIDDDFGCRRVFVENAINLRSEEMLTASLANIEL